MQACKAVVAAHRLMLSGTPIQNNIGELWGLFDWLMPGFLGTEKAFQVPPGGCLTHVCSGECAQQMLCRWLRC